MAVVKDALASTPSLNGKDAPTSAQHSPYRAVTARELRTLVVPPREWIITNILPRGLQSAIVAQSGTGKTWLMLDLARALATGGLWAGKYHARKSIVGILDLEGDYTGLKERWLQLEGGHGQLSDDAAGRIFFLSDIGGVNVLDKDTAKCIQTSITTYAIEVLFVDTLSRTHNLDENSADMRLVMIELERIARDTGCTVILAHHAGKDSARGGRGSSTIKDALQHMIELTAIERDGEVIGAKVALTKAKSAPLIKHMCTIHIEPLAVGAGVRIAYDDEVPKTGRPDKGGDIEDYLRTHIGAPRIRTQIVNQLVENEVCSKATAERFMTEALSDGRLKKDGQGRVSLGGALSK